MTSPPLLPNQLLLRARPLSPQVPPTRYCHALIPGCEEAKWRAQYFYKIAFPGRAAGGGGRAFYERFVAGYGPPSQSRSRLPPHSPPAVTASHGLLLEPAHSGTGPAAWAIIELAHRLPVLQAQRVHYCVRHPSPMLMFEGP